MQLIKKVQNAFQHVGSGNNVNLYTLARNALPYYTAPAGSAFTPLTIFLSVNSVCNARCKMCDIGQQETESSFYKNLRPESARDRLSFERLESLVEEAATFRPRPRISVTTTEPLLYKDLFRLARLVTERGLEFHVTTNGYRLARHADDILESGIRELGVSIDGPPALHDDIRGIPGMFDSIREGLETLYNRQAETGRTRPKVTLLVVITNHNYHDFARLFDELPEHLYDRAIVSHMNFMDAEMAEEHNKQFGHIGIAEAAGTAGGTDSREVDVPTVWEQIAHLKETNPKVHFSPDYTREDLEIFYHEPHRFVWDNTCYIPWFVMEVLANGDVVPLTRCMHKKLGNVYENSLQEIWQGSEYRALRNALQKHRRFPICTRCRGIL